MIARTAGSWRIALRLARADARRHRLRTLLGVLLVCLPTSIAVLAGVLTLGVPSGAEAALRRLPTPAQARIVATALERTGLPLPQPPEGITQPLPVGLDTRPASPDEISAIIGAGEALHPYWRSGQLLLGPGDFDPFNQAGAALDLDAVVTAQLTEAGPAILPLLRPQISEGREPSSASEVLLPRQIADQIGVGLGGLVTVFGPPPTGWVGADGNVDTALAGQVRSFTVVGLSESNEALVWSQPGWLSAAVTANPAGINQSYLLLGEEPLTWAQVRELNLLQVWATSRQVLTNYPAEAELYPVTPDPQALLATLVGLVIGALLTVALLLFTITPAFTVSAEQAQRTLGLAAAAGATPADLRRIIQAQGVLIGLFGGGFGALVGMGAGLAWLGGRYPLDGPFAFFPWWTPPLAALLALGAGLLAATPPARRVARANTIRALAGRPLSAGPGRLRSGWVGWLLLAVGFGVAAWSIGRPLTLLDPMGPPILPLTASLQIVAVFVLIGLGVLLNIGTIFAIVERVGRNLGVGARLALGDARLHRGRAWPAAAAVLVTTAAASVLPVQLASSAANELDNYYVMAANGHLLAGPTVPVSESFDQAVLTTAATNFAATIPIKQRHPVRSWDFGDQQPQPQTAPGRSCPTGQFPTLESIISRSAPFDCGPVERWAGLTSAWLLGSDIFVLDAEAVRSSGLVGAEQAAEVLAAGGVLVNSANLIDADDMVSVAIGTPSPMTGEIENPESVTKLPGAFLAHFAGRLTMTPQTAAELGLELPRLVGEYWVTDRPLGAVAQLLGFGGSEQSDLVMITAQHTSSDGTVSYVLLGLLVTLAIGATVISLALARVQSLPDLATMAAAGATPGFVRRFGLLQSGVLFVGGVPLGAGLGVGLGVYWVAWLRQIGWQGVWRLTVIPWPLLLGLWTAITVGALLGALVIGRRLPALTRRRLT